MGQQVGTGFCWLKPPFCGVRAIGVIQVVLLCGYELVEFCRQIQLI